MRRNRKPGILLSSLIALPFLVLLCAGTTFGAASPPEGPQPYFAENQWDLSFSEDFDSQALDQNKWTTCYWWGNQGCTIQSNHELEWYMPANVSLQDGALQLTAQRQTVKGSDGKTYPYTSGMVTTGSSSSRTKYPAPFAFKYGYVEVRAWVPKDQGLLPAIWILPTDQQALPEIDIMEMLGSDPQTVHLNFHYSNSSGKEVLSEGQWTSPAEIAGNWHTFAVDWEPDAITWYVDGVPRRVFTQTNLIPAKPMYLIMDLAVGGDWPGSPNAQASFPSAFKIDYVRVWKHGGNAELSPVADAYTDATQPNRDFGADNRLLVDGSPKQDAYMKFDLSQLAGMHVQSAWLRVMTAREADSGSNNAQTLHVVTQNNWDELGLTHANAPPYDSGMIGQIAQTEPGVIYDIPLDSQTVQNAAGGTLSIAVTTEYADGLAIYSRRFPSDGPRLIVTYASSYADFTSLLERVRNALHP